MLTQRCFTQPQHKFTTLIQRLTRSTILSAFAITACLFAVDARAVAPVTDCGGATAVLSLPGPYTFSGEGDDHVEVPHDASLELTDGTFSMRFIADDVADYHALFSKDFSGNREGGDITAFLREGRIKVRLQSAEHSVWAMTPVGIIQTGTEYHVAVTFGSDGLWIYVNGQIMAWKPEFYQGLEVNTQSMAIGASTWGRTETYPEATWDPFAGEISDFEIYGCQFDSVEVATLSGFPPETPPTNAYVADGWLFGTDADEDLDATTYGVTNVHGGYGDDIITGTPEADMLDGGHGEDMLIGGEGDDILYSFADGREPVIAQDYDPLEDDPDNEINPTTRTFYAYQPIEGDDVLIGGGGADTFHFRALINAKRSIILKHINDDGTINWGMGGVAGENDEVHDHWVERIGDEVIWDFSREEGDHIEVVGHTVEVYKREYDDADGDGIVDSTVLHVWSNQGNGGGAHNKDLLGTIRVFGDLVMSSDYTVEQVDYGIVPTIHELDEAITPRVYTSVADDGTPPPFPDTIDDGDLPAGAVLAILNKMTFVEDEKDHVEIEHLNALELEEGTFALNFNITHVDGYHGLFSKDYSGNREGGDITAFVANDRIKVRLQSSNESVYVKTPIGSILPNEDYHLAVTFGPDGFALYLNGQIMDWESEFQQSIQVNTQNLAIGANIWSRNEWHPYKTWDHFDGCISNFVLYGAQYDYNEIAVLAGYTPEPPPTNAYVAEGWLFGTDADEDLDAATYGVTNVHGGYGDDIVTGTPEADMLDGGHGEDKLIGGEGDDILYSFADGREPVIAQDYDPLEDDPDNEINPTTRTYYAYQPIEADDVLIGGGGADLFHFRALINAKREIILRHVNSDGTIEWGMGGVAGENDEVHDHWVERIGDEVIYDFSREEGDHIEVVGHTVEVYKRTYEDADGDGVVDSTVLHVWSNQGNGGGAHNKDLLGTIRVFGDLVMSGDYTVEQIDYGIVPTIYDLEEAITPRVYTSVADDGTPPPFPDTINDGDLPSGAVFAVLDEMLFDDEEEDIVEITHKEAFELAEGTFALDFNTTHVDGYHGLFSKDYSGNREGGDITAFLAGDRIKVRLQSSNESVYARTPEGVVEPNQDYHLAVTFGPDGLWIYLDGQIMALEPDFHQGLLVNTQSLAIGANIWARSEECPHGSWDHFDGSISNFVIYGQQLDDDTVAVLAGYTPEPPPTNAYVAEGWLFGTDADEDLDAATYSVTNVHGGYGDDIITGTPEADMLDGGHGEDKLIGGEGDDILYSFADGREPVIAQDYDPIEDDPDSEINPTTRTYYAYQPIEADDVLIGGGGADLFHFRALINAKRSIILKHINDDGTIEWGMNGVAGENDEVHDHWVERIGDEVIYDFSREEGDHIEVVGHTVEVYKRVYDDADGDGVVDSTVLHVWSNQGNGGGAHNKDLLGTIRVFGDLVMASDYTVEQIDYGIVPTIHELDEAITPRVYTSVADDGAPPPFPDVIDDGDLPPGGVFAILDTMVFDDEEEDHIEIEHDETLELSEGTIELAFNTTHVDGYHGLFSKDYSGNREGGDITAFLAGDRIKVRLQSSNESVYAKTPEGVIEPNQEYHLAVTFGPDGLWIYLNGQMMAWKPEFYQSIQVNTQNLAIGANIWSRSEWNPYGTWDHFDGTISNFVIHGTQYDFNEVAVLAGFPPDPPPTSPYVADGWLFGTDSNEHLNAATYGVHNVHAGYGDDVIMGTSDNNMLDGGHGEDRLIGGEGDDILYSFADGREPVIAQDYDPLEDDPDNEINPTTRTYYAYQPIEADDILIGGGGADLFHFRALINAKRNIILKHINDDGTIEWGMNGVAGENNEVHDHWVERIGDEVIYDFSREEGDHIEVVGHTVEVYKRVHQDSDGDGILDSTVLYVWSNQGNGGGAHNKDLLGTITVFGDLVMKSDYTVEQIDYGIVPTLADLEEAIRPRVYTSVADDGAPPPYPAVDDGELPPGAVFGVLRDVQFSGESQDHIEVAHQQAFEIDAGSIAMRFTTDEISSYQGLYSKDYTGNREGGDITIYLAYDRVKVRLQSSNDSVYAITPEGIIQAGQEHHVAVTFGSGGLRIYLDGVLRAAQLEFTQGIGVNTQSMAIGANTWSRNEWHPYKTWDPFAGSISDFLIFNSQYSEAQVAALANTPSDPGDPPASDGTPMDSEGDGMGDVWQAMYGVASGDSLEDPDADGMMNKEEAEVGTNPFDASSAFVIKHLEKMGEGNELSWLGIDGQRYIVQCSVDMITWHDVDVERMGNGQNMVEELPAAQEHFFYRVCIVDDKDMDQDGLTDWEERMLGTDAQRADTDGDGVSDGDEVHVHGTDPLMPNNV